MYKGMSEPLLSHWNKIKSTASSLATTLGLRRRHEPVTTPSELRRFVEQRAKYIAQTTLYGYLKTRAGTRYTSLFENELFVESINIAKWEIYLACLSDLSVYAAARVGREAGAAPDEMTALATHLVNNVLDEEEIPAERPKGFADAKEAFVIRAGGTNWTDIDDSEDAFQRSPAALVEWAPIAPELKDFDTDIVINSMRFKWKHVRDELRGQMQPDQVLAGWRDGSAGSGSA